MGKRFPDALESWVTSSRPGQAAVMTAATDVWEKYVQDDDAARQPSDTTTPDHGARNPISRRMILAGAGIGSAATAAGFLIPHAGGDSASEEVTATVTSAGAGVSGLPDSLRRVVEAWKSSPSSHPLLGDWRRVGYRRGTREPRLPNHVVTARALGVRPGEPQDVSAALQKALDDLGARGGGVLKLDPGRYVLDNPLFIHGSSVVLAGAGKKKTTLFFNRPLRDSIRATFGWSWTGGQIYFIPKERLVSAGAPGQPAGGGETWLPGPQLATVAPAVRGTHVLEVDKTTDITPGAMVLLQVEDPPGNRLLREIAGDIPGAASYDWPRRAPVLNETTWTWPVVVTDVLSPRTLRIEQPLRISIHPETPARITAIGPTVHDSGVEGLTIENKLLPQTTHNQNPGSNGVCFQAVYDCWARDIHVLNADVAYGMTGAKSCTLSGFSAGGRSLHHFTISRAGSHDNLMQDFELEDFTVPAAAGSYLHGLSCEALSSGNVWRRGTMHTGTFDSHRAMSFENLRTDILITNKDAVPGGAFNAGPYFGARMVHWGVSVTNNENLCMDITDQAPRALTAGITGLTQPGSRLNGAGIDFEGDLQSERLEFGTDLGAGRDLLDIQRKALPY
ncbi:pectate lyase family protein [Parafrankia colletiae]|uniref:hypothetical protein n=1 Tax=Parafrankia colletiae TaxID=573497 RepID=UPI001041FD32|nr:hypothetical protein [Parafrankia colletiae]